MSKEEVIEGPVFSRNDCAVYLAETDYEGKTSKNHPPRYNAGTAGQIVNGRYDLDALKEVTVMHTPTGISASVREFHPARNKELAFLEVERLVNEYLDTVRKRIAKNKV